VSNDQSPPARKVIPYKKGGQRKSPFADLAFQFSGTALDVAIQQREEKVEDAPPEVSEPPALAPPADAADSVNDLAPEDKDAQVVTAPAPPAPPPPAEAQREDVTPTLAAAAGSPSRQRRPPSRNVRLITEKRVELAAPPAAADDQLQAFTARWKPFLTETQLGICAYVYNNSAANGQEYCFTSTAKLMAAVSKTERQVKTVLNQLTDWGFLIKGETVVNAPRERRGTYYKLEVTKS
jgi:hypothetical protein